MAQGQDVDSDIIVEESDVVAVGNDPAAARFVEQRPQPRQTPPQGRAGVIRNRPEQGGQPITTMRSLGEGKIGKQRARLL